MYKRLKSKTFAELQKTIKKRQFIKNDTNDWAKSTVSKSVFTKKQKEKKFIY
jgi:hypothetical protein